MQKFLGALIGAILVGVTAMYVLGFFFTGTLQIVGWLLGVLIGLLVFYAIYKMLSNKVQHAVAEHKQQTQAEKDKAAVQDDLRQMEADNPSDGPTKERHVSR